MSRNASTAMINAIVKNPDKKVPEKVKSFMKTSSGIIFVYGILGIMHIVMYVCTLVWMWRVSVMKDCECAKDWRRSYILSFPIVSLVLALLTMSRPGWPRTIINIMLSLGWIAFIIAALDYLKILKERKCLCATSGLGDETLHLYAFYPIILLVVTIISAIILAAAWRDMQNK